LHQQRKIDVLKQTIIWLIVEIALHRRERRKALWRPPLLTADPCDIQDRVKHGAQLNLARPPQGLAAGIRGSINGILHPSHRLHNDHSRAHTFAEWFWSTSCASMICFITTFTSQPAEITQPISVGL
jgi:hypothetical protein